MAIHALADLDPAHECARRWYFLFCSSVFGPLANAYPIERHGFPDGDICEKEGWILCLRKCAKHMGGLGVPQAFLFSCLSIAGGPGAPTHCLIRPCLGGRPLLFARMLPLLTRMLPFDGSYCMKPSKPTSLKLSRAPKAFHGPKWLEVLGGVGFALWALLGKLKVAVYKLKSSLFKLKPQNWSFWILPRANFGPLSHQKLQIQDLAPTPIKPSLF